MSPEMGQTTASGSCCKGGELTAECVTCIQPILLDLCAACREGFGGECHTPGCSLWLNRAPDLPLRGRSDA
jgi:hypothetical protein